MRGLERVCRIFLLGATWLATSASVIAADSRPNILLIVADDLGYSDLGCYGGEIQTPHLDALAADGLRLSRFYNTGRCCPSRASILTGQYPHRVGLGHMTQDLGRPGYRGRVAPDATTIAQRLAPLQYRCFIAGKWHLGTEDPTQHGFEEFYGTLVSAKTFWDPDHFTRLPIQQATQPATRQAGQQDSNENFYGTDAVTDHAIEFLKLAGTTSDQPWFLYLAYNAPHFPLQARSAEIAKYADRYHVGWDVIRQQRLERMKALGIVSPATQLSPRSEFANYGQTESGVNPAWDDVAADRRGDLARRMAIYAAMVDSLDANIGRLLSTLQAWGQRESTLVIFLSDNGACAEWDPWGFDLKSSPHNILHRGEQIESMGGPGTFHSVGSGWANASNTPWRLYKHYNHEGGINSPCILSWPKHLDRQGQIDATPAHVIDLMPTLLEIASADDRLSADLPGKSLVPLIRGEELPERQLFFEHEGNRAVVEARWKLVAKRGQPWELYDASQDRTELNNLSAHDPHRVDRMSNAWARWADENEVTPLPVDYHVDYLRETGNDQ